MPVRETVGLQNETVITVTPFAGLVEEPPTGPVAFSVDSDTWVETVDIIPGVYHFEVHLDKTGNAITTYMNGDGLYNKDFSYDLPYGYGMVVFGDSAGGRTDETGSLPDDDAKAHYELRNLTIGTSRGGTELFGDNLSGVPQPGMDPYDGPYANYPYVADALSEDTIDGGSWLKVNLVPVEDSAIGIADLPPGGAFAYLWESSADYDIWITFDVNISEDFYNWLDVTSVYPTRWIDICNIYGENGDAITGDGFNGNGPTRIGIWRPVVS